MNWTACEPDCARQAGVARGAALWTGRINSPLLALGLVIALAWLLALPRAVWAQAETTAATESAADIWHEFLAAAQLGNSFRISSAGVVREGDDLVFTLEIPDEGFLNVVTVNHQGKADVLYPQPGQVSNRVAAGSMKFPQAGTDFRLTAMGPFGRSMLAAFLTKEPLNLAQVAQIVPGLRSVSLSELGRRALIEFANRSLLSKDAASKPLAVGITTLVTCPKSGVCGSAAAERIGGAEGLQLAFGILRRVVPGIFKDAESAQEKSPPKRRVYDRGLSLVKASEGFVSRLYHDQVGHCTIAYGHLVNLNACGPRARELFPMPVDIAAGTSLLLSDMAKAQRAVERLVKVPLTDGQYAALTDFTFNVGSGNLERSTLLMRVNAGEHMLVPEQLRKWVSASGKILPGLVTRRSRETLLYMEHLGMRPKDLADAVTKGADLSTIGNLIDISQGEQ